MKLHDVNPHIRFASRIHYTSQSSTVKVSDCRIFYIAAGQAQLHIAGKHYALHPHSLFYCCGGSEYTIEAPAGFDPLCLNFALTQAHSGDILPYPTRSDGWDAMNVNFDVVEDSSLLSSHFYMADAGSLRSSIHRIVEEFSAKEPYFQQISSGILKELLVSLHRLSPEDIPPKIRRVKVYIDEHYASDLTNKQLASMAGYHQIYLNRIFLSCLGMNLHQYLLKTRLNQASFLILNTNLPLKAIPELVGFHSYPHFSSYFKQYYGLYPAQYRKIHQKGI